MTRDAEAICEELRAAIVRTGWSETARRCGIDRTALHRSFRPKRGNGQPSFVTVSLVAEALGLRLSIERPDDGGRPAA